MEPNLRDTPIRRFNTFFWGLALFVVFAVLLLVYRCGFLGERNDNYDPNRAARAEVIEKVNKRQTEESAKFKTQPEDLIKHPELILTPDQLQK